MRLTLAALLFATSAQAQLMAPPPADQPEVETRTKLDLPATPPFPGTAVAYSIALPGAGWFSYLPTRCGRQGSDWVYGVVHLAATIGGGVVARNGARRDDDDAMAAGIAIAAISRLVDLIGVSGAAEERHLRCAKAGS